MKEDEQEPEPWVMRTFTLAGRLLLLGLATTFVGGTITYVAWIREDLPQGRYPLLLFAVPVGLGAVLFFLGLAWLFELLGIRIYKR